MTNDNRVRSTIIINHQFTGIEFRYNSNATLNDFYLAINPFSSRKSQKLSVRTPNALATNGIFGSLSEADPFGPAFLSSVIIVKPSFLA